MIGCVKRKTHCCITKLIHNHGDAVAMLFREDVPAIPDKWIASHTQVDIIAHLRSVDFPAPRNPQMIVRGTRDLAGDGS